MPHSDGWPGQPAAGGLRDGSGRAVAGEPIPATVSGPDLYAISHDLKNRLTLIKGWADLLQRRVAAGLDRPAILQGLATIRSSAEAMDELLGELLYAGRVELGHRQHLPRADVDLWELTERLVEQHRPLAQSHALTVTGPGAGQVIGNWDAGSIERILANLLSNAIKYSPSSGQIMITIEQGGQEARLAVHDHGIGIPRPALPHIFEPFYRAGNVADQHDSPSVSGIGIGLFAARKLANQHDGRIEVTSTERQGSTFTLVLPLRGYPRAARDGAGQPRSHDAMKERSPMPEDVLPDDLAQSSEGSPQPEPAAEADETDARWQVMPRNTGDDPAIDVVDFQSMQSFPASDPPAWPRRYSDLAGKQPNRPDST
ncbi:MAG TPA: HAMP domain-containing sensor histidine kinase, partial [Thermomicrobiales bacterium]|nr:HAMP domain-containing sensor histidine kinase [Thermomicrobiales bacterium]